MAVIPTSAVAQNCTINNRYKFLVGFHMGKQVQILSGDALRSKATTVMLEKIGSNWKGPLR
jgi:hypothetical protein